MATPRFPAANRGLYAMQHQAQLEQLQAGRRVVRQIAPTGVLASFDVEGLVRQVSAAQLHLARAAALATTASLAEQGAHVPALALPDPAGAVGVMAPPADGVWLVEVEDSARKIASRLDEAARAGTTPHALRQAGALAVDRLVTTALADSARMVSSVEVAARPRVQYVRQLVLPSCPRCMQLAGKIFRWNQGFQRHPSCDCQHVPTMARTFEEAAEQGLAASPYDLFNALTHEQQDRYFGRFNAQAIRDGADFHQVVNATSARGRPGGRSRVGLTTSEGTTKRSQWVKRRGGFRPRARLTPEGIYRQAEQWGLDRRGVLGMLERHGYILPEGQVPGGALRPSGQLGFGQYGRGGTRKAAAGAVLDANATGMRDPRSIYTMTAAERRVYEARRNYELALADIHPGSDLAVHMRGGARISWDPGQVTPKDLAGFEQEWRLQAMAKGEAVAYRALRRDLERVLVPRALDFSDIPAEILDAAHAARLAGQALPREFYQARQAKLAARSGRGGGAGAGQGRSGGIGTGGGRSGLPPAGAGGGGGRKPPKRSGVGEMPEPSRRGGFAHLYEDPLQLPELQISRDRGIADTGYRVGIVHIPSGFMEKTRRGVVVEAQPGKLLSVGGHSVAERVVTRDRPITAWGASYSERGLWEILNRALHGVTREPVSTGPSPRRLKRRVVINGHDSRHEFRITLLENRTRSEFLTVEQFHPISGQDIVTIPAGSPPRRESLGNIVA